MIFGCIDFTLPPNISGNPVKEDIEETLTPATRRAFAVPPVAISLIFCFTKNFAKGIRPFLFETERRAVFGLIFIF